MRRSTTFSLIAQNISLYFTNYTKFCDPIPKIWTYLNYTGLISNYVMQLGDFSRNIS